MTNHEYLLRLQRQQMGQQQAGYHSQLQQAQMMNCGIYTGLGLGGMAGCSNPPPFINLELNSKVSVSKSSPLCWDFDDYMAEIEKELASE